jgi:hypothetical protein
MRRHAVGALALALVACGGGERPADAAPPQARRLVATTMDSIRVRVGTDLSAGTCEAVTGDVWNRPDLRAASLVIEPNRRILVLTDSAGRLALYQDQVIGRGGYSIRLDFEADSGSVLDRTTRTGADGTAASLRERADLGPPSALAAEVLRRCGGPATH